MCRPTNIVGTSGRRPGIAFGLALVIGPIGAAEAEQIHQDVIVYPPQAKGTATFVTAGDRGSIPVSLPADRTAAEPMDFLNQYGHLFGVSDAATELTSTKTDLDNLGQTHTTYQQLYSGIRVFGGILKVHQDSQLNIIAANGHFLRIPRWLKSTPTLSPDTAAAAAQAEIARGRLTVEQNELVVVDPGSYGDPPMGPHLAYHVIVSDLPAFIREAFFIDAHTGRILDRWTLTETVLYREVYFGQNTQNTRVMPARFEGEDPSYDSDANRAYDYTGDFYDFFWRMFDRDGLLDGSPFTMYATVHWGALPTIPPTPCPGGVCCPNAFWNGVETAYCTGVAQDDVVGHEWAHALTGRTAGLVYENQPGQLNESYSDIWGELIDLFNGNAGFSGEPSEPHWPVPDDYFGPGTDTPNNLRPTGQCSPYSSGYYNGVRWLLAEDSTSVNGFRGELRDMWEPTCHYHPDRANHVYQTCNPDDNGGVHSGSGIPNHAFAMLTDGKTFNNHTVEGIGPIKAAAVWYRALLYYLTSISDFEDAYIAMHRAAQDLIGTFPNDPRTGDPSGEEFTAFDAVQVDTALRAVEMNGPGRCGAMADVFDRDLPEQCSPRTNLFSDSFENGVGGWTVENTGPQNPYDWVLRDDLVLFRPGMAWFVEDPRVLIGNESARHSLISPYIDIPTEVNELHAPKLIFTHYVATEYPADGGNVKISVNDGPFELIEDAAFEHNFYNATIWGTGTIDGNPLQGQRGWTGVAAGWGTSLVDLSSLVEGGDTIRIRFDFGKDPNGGYDGWYVDNFTVYVCTCDNDAFCDDGVFCNGAETCVGGFCRKGDEPCADDYCDEADTACIPAVFWDDFNNGNLRGWELASEENSAGEDGWWTIGNPTPDSDVRTPVRTPEDCTMRVTSTTELLI
ncbi:MAG: M4 family metallopeptidase [Planctomycetota bacterium]|jgi:Zn-dependent metalloprotease